MLCKLAAERSGIAFLRLFNLLCEGYFCLASEVADRLSPAVTECNWLTGATVEKAEVELLEERGYSNRCRSQLLKVKLDLKFAEFIKQHY